MITRQDLAERTGIPIDTLKDLESGRFGLNAESAMKIMLGTGVDGESLLRKDDPLLDLSGEPVSADSKKLVDFLFWGEAQIDSVMKIFAIVLVSADEKGRAAHFYFLLSRWIERTAEALGILPEIRKNLEDVFDSLHPDLALPDSFYPQNKRDRSRWEMIQRWRIEEFADLIREYKPILKQAGSREQLVKLKGEVEKKALKRLNAKQQELVEFLRKKSAGSRTISADS